MLPLPGAPSSTWSLLTHRLSTYLSTPTPRIFTAFWLFGLVNNILYVILLSAALDLVGPTIPKGTVLLADVLPSFLVKLTAPYYIHLVSYDVRIWIFCALSAGGMVVVAVSAGDLEAGGLAAKMLGIVCASLSSGGGELSFLSLTHYYGDTALAAWGSGTGGAGLLGAGLYALLTTTFQLSVRATLLASAALPAVMLASFFAVLPRAPLREARKHRTATYPPVPAPPDPNLSSDNHDDAPSEETAGLLSQPPSSPKQPAPITSTLTTNLTRARALLLPYMLPLFLVYTSEYTINLGVLPTILFPLASTPFSSYREFYPLYSFLYQLGVFVSRSSLPFLRIRTLYTPSVLQVGNLGLLVAHAIRPFLPSVWWVFAVVFWEGLLGGLVYVSTFAAIREEVAEGDREFSLGATTVSDSAGICLAGFASIGVERALCAWQVEQGRDWCRRL